MVAQVCQVVPSRRLYGPQRGVQPIGDTNLPLNQSILLQGNSDPKGNIMALFNVRITRSDNGNTTVRRFEGEDVHAAIAWGTTQGKVTEVAQVVALSRTTLEIIG